MSADLTQSKVLVLEDDEKCKQSIKTFCEQNKLIALSPTSEDPLTVLKTFVDLSAIFISDSLESYQKTGLELAAEVHSVRPELPIFFRSSQKELEDTPQSKLTNLGVCDVYHIDDIDCLKADLDEHIFNQDYPNALLRGIEEIGQSSLEHFFENVTIECSAPYLVKDRIIHGHLFSLIPIESTWCKGYMMIQTSQENIRDLVDKNKSPSDGNDNFREINDILSEITNMIWGGLKNRFISKTDLPDINYTQIPIIVNHQNQYISFGTTCPHLCFKYTICSKDNKDLRLTIFHKFIFHINWDPDRFSENSVSVDDCLDSGELEFF